MGRFGALAALLVVALGGAAVSGQGAGDAPRYERGTDLVLPADYRTWVFVSSGLGMDYRSDAVAERPRFGNVFVNPSSYRAFLETGAWPDRTTFVLEIRASAGEASINRAGRFQDRLVALEVEVKDARLPGGWAFYDFGATPSGAAAPLPERAGCQACHTEHGAVEQTFVQFYPTLLDVAREKGTVRPGF